jgi:hypothetical protein
MITIRLVVYKDVERWYKDGEIHREICPAYFDTTTGYKGWWLEGKRIKIETP